MGTLPWSSNQRHPPIHPGGAVPWSKVRESLSKVGLTTVGGSADEFRAFLKTENAKWENAVKLSGVNNSIK